MVLEAGGGFAGAGAGAGDGVDGGCPLRLVLVACAMGLIGPLATQGTPGSDR
jgi:hypothetical protein